MPYYTSCQTSVFLESYPAQTALQEKYWPFDSDGDEKLHISRAYGPCQCNNENHSVGERVVEDGGTRGVKELKRKRRLLES